MTPQHDFFDGDYCNACSAETYPALRVLGLILALLLILASAYFGVLLAEVVLQ